MKKLILLILAFSTLGLFAQKKEFTMNDAIYNYSLYPKSLSGFQWVDDSHFSYTETVDNEKVVLIREIDATKNGREQTLTHSSLNESLLAAFPDADSIKKLPRFRWLKDQALRYKQGNDYYLFSLLNSKTTKLGSFDMTGVTTHKLHSESLNHAFVKEDQLYVQINGKDEVKLSEDGGNGIVYGQAVHRYEFGITEGLFWSEDGKSLAFYRKDETMVSDYPLYVMEDKPSTTKGTRYPVAGDPSHHATIGVHHSETDKTIYLKTGEPKEQFLTNIAWGPKGKNIYVAVVNREQNHLWLKEFDAISGEYRRTLFEETHNKYVEPEHPVQFLKSDPNKFIWWSERDGFNHLYLYKLDGTLDKQLTKGKWVVTQVFGADENDENLFIESTKESPIDRDLYCVNMKSGRMKRLTQDPGTHNITPSPGFRYFYDNFSNTVTPRECRIFDAAGIPFETIFKADHPAKDYALGKMEISSIKTKDGTELYYRLFKPVDFDPSKKYPVIVYLYNGPHAQMVRNRWLGGANYWYHYLAQRGYLVFTIDGRGSAYRGLEFENAIFRNVGEIEMNDQLEGLNWLLDQGFADKDRLGIHGWSYGGFMTTSMMTRHPGIFKVGVAGGPVIDWRYYEIMYTERYMDTPEENPEGYKKTNLLNHADKLEGRLLMIHGAQDPTVLWQHSLMYLQKSIEKGVVNLDYYVYPHHQHNVRGKDRVHLYEKVTEYLMRELEVKN